MKGKHKNIIRMISLGVIYILDILFIFMSLIFSSGNEPDTSWHDVTGGFAMSLLFSIAGIIFVSTALIITRIIRYNNRNFKFIQTGLLIYFIIRSFFSIKGFNTPIF